MTFSSIVAQFRSHFTPSGRRESQSERDARKRETAALAQRATRERGRAEGGAEGRGP